MKDILICTLGFPGLPYLIGLLSERPMAIFSSESALLALAGVTVGAISAWTNKQATTK